jgi:hypothetical protein
MVREQSERAMCVVVERLVREQLIHGRYAVDIGDPLHTPPKAFVFARY